VVFTRKGCRGIINYQGSENSFLKRKEYGRERIPERDLQVIAGL